MENIIRARVNPGRDDDLIEWLGAQPAGLRSEAIRTLMRDGLRMRQLEANLAGMVRQAVAEALAGMQVMVDRPDMPADTQFVDAAVDRRGGLVGLAVPEALWSFPAGGDTWRAADSAPFGQLEIHRDGSRELVVRGVFESRK